MTELAKQKLSAKMIAEGYSEDSIKYEIKAKEQAEAFAKYRKKIIKKSAILKLIDNKCDLITEDDYAIVYEFYGKRKNYEFCYDKKTQKIQMRWCWVNDEYQEWNFDSKEITKISQLAMMK